MAVMTQTLNIAFDIVDDEIREIVEEEVIGLHNDLIDAGQAVWLSGNFKNSFAPVIKKGDFEWRIENDADYASILARGRRLVNGRMYGSEKWARGMDPMIAKMEDKIEKRTDAIQS
ncbi:MAG: hypothetical protein DRG09_06925 [Epsilonproteobacteria bacterium]|nr:MAG: hypothetical protein DRG09_06925 [Campylobacterota bacterium]